MKRLIFLLFMLPLFVSAQQTFWTTSPSGWTALSSPAFRFKTKSPDSTNSLLIFNPLTGRYNEIYTAVESNARFFKKTDTGTTALPSIYSLSHRNWTWYGTHSFMGTNVTFSSGTTTTFNGIVNLTNTLNTTGAVNISNNYIAFSNSTSGVENRLSTGTSGRLELYQGTGGGGNIQFDPVGKTIRDSNGIFWLKTTDTGTTALPSINSLSHLNWDWYGTHIFHNNVTLQNATTGSGGVFRVNATGSPLYTTQEYDRFQAVKSGFGTSSQFWDSQQYSTNPGVNSLTIKPILSTTSNLVQYQDKSGLIALVGDTTGWGNAFLRPVNNLSDVSNKATSRINLSVYSIAQTNAAIATVASSIPIGGNPTATAGINVNNGSALTWMRSDATPPIDSTSTGFKTNGAATIDRNNLITRIAAKVNISDTSAFARKTGNSSIINLNYAVNGTAGNGYTELLSQSASPVAASGKLRLYSDSLNRLSWKNSTYRRTIRATHARDETFTMPFRNDPILADSSDVAAAYQPIGTYLTPSSTNTVTNKDLTSGTNTFPTFNQNTTGSAAKWTTARTINISGVTATGQSIDGSGNVTIPVTAVPTSLFTGTLAAGQVPAFTGDITNSAGSLATTLAASISGTHTWTGLQNFNLGTTYNGATSGVISILPQAVAGTYNWNLPTTAGTAGQALASGGGGSTAMTWNNVPITKALGNLTAQTAAGNITTFTVGASTNTFSVWVYINVTAVSTDVIQAQITYTDENNTAQTVSFSTLNAIGNSTYSPITIRAKNATVITLKTNLTVGAGSITFDAGGAIIQN